MFHHQRCIQAVWDTSIPVWAPKLWLPKSNFQVFYFQFYSNKKYLEVAINKFTMDLIILKWLRLQKCRQKREAMIQRDGTKRGNCQ